MLKIYFEYKMINTMDIMNTYKMINTMDIMNTYKIINSMDIMNTYKIIPCMISFIYIMYYRLNTSAKRGVMYYLY